MPFSAATIRFGRRRGCVELELRLPANRAATSAPSISVKGRSPVGLMAAASEGDTVCAAWADEVASASRDGACTISQVSARRRPETGSWASPSGSSPSAAVGSMALRAPGLTPRP